VQDAAEAEILLEDPVVVAGAQSRWAARRKIGWRS